MWSEVTADAALKVTASRCSLLTNLPPMFQSLLIGCRAGRFVVTLGLVALIAFGFLAHFGSE
jgi:hypothetical protein